MSDQDAYKAMLERERNGQAHGSHGHVDFNPGVAAVLALLFPGAGHLYRQQIGAGIGWFFGIVMGYFIFVLPGIVLHLLSIVLVAKK